MKIIFFGTPIFSVPTLELLFSSKHEILAVITGPDIKKGRGLKVHESPVSKISQNLHLDIYKPVKLSDSAFITKLESYEADLFIVVAYKILPTQIFNMPKYGTINLHASLLPKYRGAAPIQRAILNGDTETGVSTFIIEKKIDTGNIVMQKEVDMNNENYGQLHDRLSNIGSDLVISSIKHILNKEQISIQLDSPTYAPKIKKSETQIKWDQNSISIMNSIRAFSPSPGAYTHLKEKRIRIFESILASKDEERLYPGIIKIKDKEILVGTSDRPIKLKKLQMEGKGVVDYKSFINGYLNAKGSDFIFETR